MTPRVPSRPSGPAINYLALIAAIVTITTGLLAVPGMVDVGRSDASTEPPPTTVSMATSSRSVASSTQPVAISTSTTSARPSTSTSAISSAPDGDSSYNDAVAPAESEAVEAVEAADVIWPLPNSRIVLDSPNAAARSFAVDLLGFVKPEIGAYRATDARSGEIEIQPAGGGPLTRITVRQIVRVNTWSVVGATCDGITLDRPQTAQRATNPLRVSGLTTASSGVVEARLYGPDGPDPLSTVELGRAKGQLEPFNTVLDWPGGRDGLGFLVLVATNPRDGAVLEASAVPLHFSS